MRRPRWRNVFIFCAVLVAVALGIQTVHAIQAQRTLSHLLSSAKRAEAAGQTERALELLDLYLQKRPRDVDAKSLAVDIALSDRSLSRVGGTQRAIKQLEDLLLLDQARAESRLRLVRLLIDSQAFGIARTHIDILKQQIPNDGRLYLYLGWVEEQAGRFSLAATNYETARQKSRDLLDAYNRLARLYRIRLNSRGKADQVMDLPQPANGLIQNNRDNQKAYLMRAIYRRSFQIDDPRDDIAKALEIAPNDLEVLIHAAREAMLTNKPDEARRFLKRAEELHPGKASVYLAGAAVETRASRFDTALETLRRGIKRIPDDPELQWNYTDLLVQLGRGEAAAPEILRLKQLGATRRLTDFLEALTLLSNQQWSEAAPKLEQVARELNSHRETAMLARRAYLGLGRCYAELGNTDLQLSSFNRALSIDASVDDRQTIQARSGVAAALVDMGRIPEAIEEYRKNLILPNAPPDTKIILARLLIFQNLRLLESYRRWEEVESLLNDAGKVVPDSSEVAILKAETLAARQQLNPARQLLEKARDDHPERADLWVALAILAQRQEQPQEAFRLLQEGQKRIGDVKEFRLARARLIGTQGGPKAGEELQKVLADTSKFTPTARREILAGVAEAYTQIGDLKQALELWKTMGAEQPRDLTPRLIQFDMALLDGQYGEVERILNELRGIEGEDGSIWRYARARVLIDEYRRNSSNGARAATDTLVRARDLLNQVAQKRPAWSRPPLSQGEIDDLLGNPNIALNGYRHAIDLGDRSALAIRRSIQIYYQQGRFDKADQILRQLQEQLPISGELQRLAAEISVQQADYQRAINLAKKAVANDSPDYKDHIWLGQVLWIVGQRELTTGKGDQARTRISEAEKELRRAIELGQDKPDAWVALIQFLVLINQRSAAEKAFADAERALPAKDAPLALAQASQALGQDERTEALYKKALEIKPDDTIAMQGLAKYYLIHNRSQEAQPLLRTLIELRTRSPEDARWANRILSMVLANQGSLKQSLKALEMLGLAEGPFDNEKITTEPIDDLRAKVYVLARQKSLARLREAKRLLEEVLRRESPVPYDLCLHGHLCELEGNWAKAREQYLNATTLMPDEPYFLIEYTRALIRHQMFADAQTWLNKFEKLKPGSPELIELKARLLAGQGKGSEAAKLVLDFVKDKDFRARVSAELLEELGQYDGAEKLFRDYTLQPDHPENVLYLAAYLGRRQRTDEALAICDKAWADCKPEDVAAATVQIIYFAERPEDYYERVATKFDQMAKQNPDKVALLFELANIRGLQGRVDEAKGIYLQTYQKNPNNVAPLNNLAWLLAFQPGKGKEALDYINQAIGGYTSVPPLLDTRGVVYLAIGEPEQALRDLEEAVTVEPNPGRQLHLAEAYLMGKRKSDAAAALKEARRIGLDEKGLHPFERKAYKTLISQLERK
jgi:tetratricopeptide (TPR) repeat protein